MPGLKKYFNEAVEFHNELMLYPKLAFADEYVTFKVKLTVFHCDSESDIFPLIKAGSELYWKIMYRNVLYLNCIN